MTANLSQARARPIAVRTWRDFENVARHHCHHGGHHCHHCHHDDGDVYETDCDSENMNENVITWVVMIMIVMIKTMSITILPIKPPPEMDKPP